MRTAWTMPDLPARGRTPLALAARVLTCALACSFLVLLALPAMALAVDAPAPLTPAAGAKATEGGSLTFTWSGSLQGDEDALARSFFRLEVAKASDVPAGAQAPWTELENSWQGTATRASLGVPTAGTYSWRVCAWGVADASASSSLEQLQDGCSATRSFTTTAAAASSGTVGTVTIEETRNVVLPTRVVTETRPAPARPPRQQQPAPVAPPPRIVELPREPATFETLDADAATTGGDSSLGMSSQGLRTEATASRTGMSGALLSGLSTTLPIVPIPYWTLVIILACVPIARWWRRGVLGMFEWPDADDQRGAAPVAVAAGDHGDLPFVQPDGPVKLAGAGADGAASGSRAPSDGARRAA